MTGGAEPLRSSASVSRARAEPGGERERLEGLRGILGEEGGRESGARVGLGGGRGCEGEGGGWWEEDGRAGGEDGGRERERGRVGVDSRPAERRAARRSARDGGPAGGSGVGEELERGGELLKRLAQVRKRKEGERTAGRSSCLSRGVEWEVDWRGVCCRLVEAVVSCWMKVVGRSSRLLASPAKR